MMQQQQPQQGQRQFLNYEITGDWSRGAGALKATPGAYQIASNWDGRYGIPGPREVADLTGIASGYRVYQMLRHADVLFAITSNLTDTKVYRKESGAWALKATISTRIPSGPQCAISFNSVLAIGFTAGNAYQYSTDVAGGAYTFTASTKTAGNSEQATCFLGQTNGVPVPRVTYALSPNEVYYTTDLTNTDGTGVNPTYISDYPAAQNYFTSIAEEPATGRVIFGMKHALYTVHYEQGYQGIVERLTEDFPEPVADAGGQSDRLNFEDPRLVGGVLYYPLGYDILAWYGSGTPYDRYMAPRWTCDNKLPRMDLPVNCLASGGGGAFLIAFLGSKNSATLKDVANFPGGNAHLAATFTVNSDMWIGVPQSGKMIWHGVALEVSNPLRGAWYDEDDHYLYMASGDSESADLQMTRCLFTADNPMNRLTSSNVILNNGTWKLEPGPIDFGSDWNEYRARAIRCRTLGLNSTTPSLEIEYKLTPDYDTTAFETNFVTWIVNEDAIVGAEFPEGTSVFRRLHLRFVGIGNGATYALLLKALLTAEMAQDMMQLPRRR